MKFFLRSADLKFWWKWFRLEWNAGTGQNPDTCICMCQDLFICMRIHGCTVPVINYLTCHCNSHTDQRRKSDSWALKIVRREAWKTKMSHDSRSSRVISFPIKGLFSSEGAECGHFFSRAIFSHHPCRPQAFHVSISFFFMRITWWLVWESVWAIWKDQVSYVWCTLPELENNLQPRD